MIKAIYDLDMTPRRSLPIIINVSQNDDLGRTLVFNLFSSTGTWTAPDSATATLEGGKPDGKFFSFNCTYSKGTVTAIIQQQMTAVSGKVTCKVKVQSGNKVIESAPIYMMVDAAGIPDGADMSKSDVNDAVAKATGKIVEQVAGSIPEDYSNLNSLVEASKINLLKMTFISQENKNGNIKRKILHVNLKAGDTFEYFALNNVNILSETDILVNGTGISKKFSKVTLTKDAEWLGLFTYNNVGLNTVYISGEFLAEKLNKISENADKISENADKISENADKISENADKISEKITGNIFYNSDNTVYKKDKLFNVPNNLKIVDFTYGQYAYSKVLNAKKAIISGYGWQSSYNYYLYAFTDKEGTVIYKEAADNKSVINKEIDIPEGAYMLYVNAHVASTLDIKLLCSSQDFDLNFNNAYDKRINKISPKLITLGDSITMLGTSDRGWVKYFIEKTNCKLIANTAMNSAVLSDYSDTVYDGNPQQSNQVNNVLGNQIQKIINNAYEAPDLILIAIGTNGGISITDTTIKNAYYDSNNILVPLESVDRKTNAGAYRYATEKLHELYPNAVIFWCTPIMGFQKTRQAENARKYAESLRIATEYSGQIMIDTIRCGINGVNEKQNALGEYLQDGLHPSVSGAKKIGYYNASKVLPFIGNLIG